MNHPPTNIDAETRAFVSRLSSDANPPIFAFVSARVDDPEALRLALRDLGADIRGAVENVLAVQIGARDLLRIATALPGVSSVEGWPSEATQRGAHARDIPALAAKEPSGGDRPIAVFVRLATEPDAAAQEMMELVGLRLFPGQHGLVRGGSLPVGALQDALALPDVEAVKFSTAMLSGDADHPQGAPLGEPDPGKISATTRMAMDEPSGNPEVAVFVEFAGQPSSAEQMQMEAAGLRIVSGAGPIKTGRVPLRNITTLSALKCIRAIEAASPLYPDNSHGTPDSGGPYDVKP